MASNEFKVQLKKEREGFEGSEIKVAFKNASQYVAGRGLGPEGKPIVQIAFTKSGEKLVRIYNKDGILNEFGFKEENGYIIVPAETIETFPDSHIAIKIKNDKGRVSSIFVRASDIVVQNSAITKQILYDKPINIELSKNYFQDILNGNIIAKAFPSQMFEAVSGLEGVKTGKFNIGGKEIKIMVLGSGENASVFCGIQNKFIKVSQVFALDADAGEVPQLIAFRVPKRNAQEYAASLEPNKDDELEVENLLNFLRNSIDGFVMKGTKPELRISEQDYGFAALKAATQTIKPKIAQDNMDFGIMPEELKGDGEDLSVEESDPGDDPKDGGSGSDDTLGLSPEESKPEEENLEKNQEGRGNDKKSKKDKNNKITKNNEQIEVNRGRFFRGIKYGFLGSICGLLLATSIFLGLAGILAAFFICLACTIGVCIITSAEATADIKEANEQALKAKTAENEQRAKGIEQEINYLKSQSHEQNENKEVEQEDLGKEIEEINKSELPIENVEENKASEEEKSHEEEATEETPPVNPPEDKAEEHPVNPPEDKSELNATKKVEETLTNAVYGGLSLLERAERLREQETPTK